MYKKNIPIDILIDALKQRGFVIGTDTYLQMHNLLNVIDIDKEFEQLHTFLCPLFAQDYKQQELFYDIYFSVLKTERVTENLPQITKTEEAKVPETKKISLQELKPEKIKSKNLLYLTAGLLTAFIIGLSIFISNSISENSEKVKDQIIEEITKIKHKEDKIKQFSENITKQKDSLIKQQKDTLLKIDKTEDSIKIPEIEREYNFRIEEKDRTILKTDSSLNIINEEKKIKEQEIQKAQEKKKQGIYNSIRYALIILIFTIFVLYEIYNLLNRRLIAKRKKEQKPPFVWGIYVENQNIDIDNHIYSAANNMRFRTQSGPAKIDISKTIDATLKKAGILNLKYKYNTKPVEYLMLIDWSSEKNHQAQLFNYLYKTFVNNNVYIERFFFDADPRICWNEDYAEGISIDKIQQKYPDAYLLVFGSGSMFINRFDNSLYKFTNIFYEWEQRALLSPVPSGEWGVQEVLLRNIFAVILPANTGGIIELTEHFNIKSGQASNLKDWKFNPQKAENYISLTADTLLSNKKIPDDVKIWITA